MAKIPSRDAFPSDISNIHVSILERCGKLKLKYFNGSITAFPIIETIANDITEYTATIATIANSRGIYCAIETIANDITEYTATNINLGDPIAVLGSIDSVLGSVDLYINSCL